MTQLKVLDNDDTFTLNLQDILLDFREIYDNKLDLTESERKAFIKKQQRLELKNMAQRHAHELYRLKGDYLHCFSMVDEDEGISHGEILPLPPNLPYVTSSEQNTNGTTDAIQQEEMLHDLQRRVRKQTESSHFVSFIQKDFVLQYQLLRKQQRGEHGNLRFAQMHIRFEEALKEKERKERAMLRREEKEKERTNLGEVDEHLLQRKGVRELVEEAKRAIEETNRLSDKQKRELFSCAERVEKGSMSPKEFDDLVSKALKEGEESNDVVDRRKENETVDQRRKDKDSNVRTEKNMVDRRSEKDMTNRRKSMDTVDRRKSLGRMDQRKSLDTLDRVRAVGHSPKRVKYPSERVRDRDLANNVRGKGPGRARAWDALKGSRDRDERLTGKDQVGQVETKDSLDDADKFIMETLRSEDVSKEDTTNSSGMETAEGKAEVEPTNSMAVSKELNSDDNVNQAKDTVMMEGIMDHDAMEKVISTIEMEQNLGSDELEPGELRVIDEMVNNVVENTEIARVEEVEDQYV